MLSTHSSAQVRTAEVVGQVLRIMDERLLLQDLLRLQGYRLLRPVATRPIATRPVATQAAAGAGHAGALPIVGAGAPRGRFAAGRAGARRVPAGGLGGVDPHADGVPAAGRF